MPHIDPPVTPAADVAVPDDPTLPIPDGGAGRTLPVPDDAPIPDGRPDAAGDSSVTIRPDGPDRTDEPSPAPSDASAGDAGAASPEPSDDATEPLFYESGDAVWPPDDGPAPGRIKGPEDAEAPSEPGRQADPAEISLDVPDGDAPAFPTPPDDVKTDQEDTTKEMSLMGHLGELRLRITRALVGVVIGFALCYGVAEQLFTYLSAPLVKVMPEGTRFIYTGVAEGFFVYLKVAIVAGIFLASPYIFYQLWSFVAPGLYREERRHVLPLAIFSAVFFLAGALFCYYGVFPVAFTFFMSYSTDTISAMPSLNEYLGFALMMLVAFGLVFEMPLLVYFLARLGIVTADRMRAVRKYAVLGAFVVGALLTPPDVFSQLLMAGPVMLLYEVSIMLAAAVGRKGTTGPKGTDHPDDADREAS